jgi:hypothetical protein
MAAAVNAQAKIKFKKNIWCGNKHLLHGVSTLTPHQTGAAVHLPDVT